MVSRITLTTLAVVAALGTFLLARAVDVAPQVPARDGGGGKMDMTAANVLFVTIVVGLAAIATCLSIRTRPALNRPVSTSGSEPIRKGPSRIDASI